ncbi:hypothetical protein [Aestuariimicrobium kwangyangense]|uniref:hypothetical protein n=1 Tax=Aestuariimicrobium kwangyangense TaxID=396389 RepID=UPI0003B66FBC|nr:hypothetical protein [Aestuariimicrobium kwangyangense]
MSRSLVSLLYGLALVVTVVGVDLAFFRGHFLPRLAANVALVLLFAAFWFRYVGRTAP